MTSVNVVGDITIELRKYLKSQGKNRNAVRMQFGRQQDDWFPAQQLLAQAA